MSYTPTEQFLTLLGFEKQQWKDHRWKKDIGTRSFYYIPVYNSFRFCSCYFYPKSEEAFETILQSLEP